MTNGTDTAYPTLDERSGYACDGLTKREMFAAMAMQGMLANSLMLETLAGEKDEIVNGPASFAKMAIKQADYLIAELNEAKQ